MKSLAEYVWEKLRIAEDHNAELERAWLSAEQKIHDLECELYHTKCANDVPFAENCGEYHGTGVHNALQERTKKMAEFVKAAASIPLMPTPPHTGIDSAFDEPLKYRELENGEIIQEGDEWEFRGKWESGSHCKGCPIDKRFSWRRPITTPAEPEYRMLRADEIVQDGDEFFEYDSRNWRGTWNIGLDVGSYVGRYRRPI